MAWVLGIGVQRPLGCTQQETPVHQSGLSTELSDLDKPFCFHCEILLSPACHLPYKVAENVGSDMSSPLSPQRNVLF